MYASDLHSLSTARPNIQPKGNFHTVYLLSWRAYLDLRAAVLRLTFTATTLVLHALERVVLCRHDRCSFVRRSREVCRQTQRQNTEAMNERAAQYNETDERPDRLDGNFPWSIRSSVVRRMLFWQRSASLENGSGFDRQEKPT